MDPRLYKSLIENKSDPSSDGSGLGHVSRSPPLPNPQPPMSPAPMPNQSLGLSGAPPAPQVVPNFSPPPSFTSGAVLPHVSTSLGSTKKPALNGTARKVGMGILAIGLGYAAYRGSKALANRAFEAAGDDVMPDLEDD